jgi:spore coat polysaccharide biosynthesis protein SpsF
VTSTVRDRGPVLAVVQARMGSTRLPSKSLRPLAGRSTLGWVVRAAAAAEEIDGVVVATTDGAEDDVLAEHAESLGASVVRGSSDDVLSRYLTALDVFDPAGVVRLTADCPLLDPAVIDLAVRTWRGDATVDYVSTILFRTLPRGLDVEVVSADALRRVDPLAHAHHRAHVTSYIYSHPDRFRLLGLVFGPEASTGRVTLDTEPDAAVLDALAAGLGDAPPAWRDVVAWLADHPEIAALNAHVEQKALEQG